MQTPIPEILQPSALLASLFLLLFSLPLYLLYLLLTELITNLLKWRRLSHIPELPRAPPHLRGPWPLGDMRHCGPMSNPFRVAHHIRHQIDTLPLPTPPLAVYRDYLCEPRLMLLSIPAMEALMSTAGTRVWRKPPTTVAVLQEVAGRQSILVAEGAAHERLRRLVTPLFAHARLLQLSGLVRQHAAALAERWASARLASHAQRDVATCTLGIVAHAAVAHAPPSLVADYRTVLEAHALSHLALFALGVAPRLARFAPLPELRRHFGALARIRAALREAVLARRAKRHVRGEDFLSRLLEAQVDGQRELTDEEVMDQIMTFVSAGHGTTSGVTSWAFYLLAGHREVQEAVRAECALALGREGDEEEDGAKWLERVDRLPLLNCVVHETLRLHPGVVMTARVATEDCMIDGVFVPRGTVASMPIMAVQRSERIWGKDAGQFRPERFADGVPRGWVPFLRGSYSCVGGRLALLEMKGILCRVLQEVRVSLAGGCEVGGFGVIFTPTGLQLRVERVAGDVKGGVEGADRTETGRVEGET